MLKKNLLEKIALSENLSGNDKLFFMRVWNTDFFIYEKKLKAWGFENFNHVLDAGSGFGQWSCALARLNKKITAIEFSNQRVNASKKIVDALKIKNCNIIHGSIEKTLFKKNSFDAIFAYSSILCTDYRKTLKEFYRILKPDGKLYFNSNGLGWYIYNLIDGHNTSDVFSSRQVSIDALENTMDYYATGNYSHGATIITQKKVILKEIKEIGFSVLSHGNEGTISVSPEITNTPFFKGEYYNLDGVYEILCKK